MNRKLTTSEFIERANKRHNEYYLYTNVNYINSKTKINIICPDHGEFEQTPNNHLNGKGCRICGENSRVKNKTLNTIIFLERVKRVHGETYDYSLTKYRGIKYKVNIICSEHGEFEQTPDNHLNGHGCPQCNLSIGELKIKELLEIKGVTFIQQKRFKDCRDKYPLSFDFYLPECNTCIEFQGEQHFKSVEFWGGDEGLKNRQTKDKIKEEYCKGNDINLILINFNDEIEIKLGKSLLKSIY